MGGNSPERMVSLASGEAVAAGLDQVGHHVLKMDPAFPEKIYTINEKVFEGAIGATPRGKHAMMRPEHINLLLASIEKYAVDFVFPILHGGWGEDGRLQALLELAGIRYLGSGPAACAIAMDKHLSKQLFISSDIPTPDYYFLPRESSDKAPEYCAELGYPLVVKPNRGGSSVGLTILQNADRLEKALSLIEELDDDILIEKYIPGREITVGILDSRGMAVVEIVPQNGFYDYRHKYTAGQTEYVCPAELNDRLTGLVINYAARAFHITRCSVFGRVDFRLNAAGKFYCLEVNTLPGMTSSSLVPKSAAGVGINFPNLVDRLVNFSMKLKR